MHMLVDVPLRQLRDEIFQMDVPVTHGEEGNDHEKVQILNFLLVFM